MTINVNRLVQNVQRNSEALTEMNSLLERVSNAVRDQTEKIHKYLIAFNEIVNEMRDNHMIPIYDAGFIAPEKQYLTVGLNALLEGAEALGIPISNNVLYQKYVDAILTPIFELNKRDRTDELMFNTEMVPRHQISGHLKSLLIDLDLPLGQQGASVKAA